MKKTGAESVLWDLSELFASPTDPEIEATLMAGMEDARAFEADYKGRLGLLPPAECAAMMARPEEVQGRVARPADQRRLHHTPTHAAPARARPGARRGRA